jgi:hypothetical protein
MSSIEFTNNGSSRKSVDIPHSIRYLKTEADGKTIYEIYIPGPDYVIYAENAMAIAQPDPNGKLTVHLTEKGDFLYQIDPESGVQIRTDEVYFEAEKARDVTLKQE